MRYGLRDVKQAAAAILEGRKHQKYYYSYNAAVIKKIDFMTLLSSLKPLEEQRCGACEWGYGGSWGWGCFLWENKGPGRAVVALELAYMCKQ